MASQWQLNATRLRDRLERGQFNENVVICGNPWQSEKKSMALAFSAVLRWCTSFWACRSFFWTALSPSLYRART